MKNPQITTALNRMMADELKAQKIELIACIIDYYRVKDMNLVNGDLFNSLYELDNHELSDMVSDLTSQIYAECAKI